MTKTGKDPMHLSYPLFQNVRCDPSSEVALYLKENVLQVIPPGMDFSNVVVHDASDMVESEIDMAPVANPDTSVVIPPSPNATPPIWDEVPIKFSSDQRRDREGIQSMSMT